MKGIKRVMIVLMVIVAACAIWWFADEQFRSQVAEDRYNKYGTEIRDPIEKERIRPSDIDEWNNGDRPNQTELLFLLAGVDAGAAGEGVRTDTLILFKVNWMDNTIHMISIPRDSYMYVEGLEDKVNHAHAYDGTRLTLQTLRDGLGIDLDFYVLMDFEAVRDLVDIAGGVEMTIEDPFAADWYLEEGPMLLDGYYALNFLRYRQGFYDGDLGRVSSQQSFLKEAIPQILHPKNFIHLPAMISTMNRYSDTNIGPLRILSMVPALFNFGSATFITDTLPGEPGVLDEISYYFLDAEGVQQMIDDYFYEYRIDTVDLP